jgi:hypothetical protein
VRRYMIGLGRAHTPDIGKNGWILYRFLICGMFVISNSLSRNLHSTAP